MPKTMPKTKPEGQKQLLMKLPPVDTKAPAIPLAQLANPALRKKVDTLAREIATYNEDIRMLEAEKEAAIAKLTALGTEYALPKLKGEGWLLMPPGSRKVLKKEKLLEQGVTMEQIEAATVEEPGKNYSVRRVTEKEEE